MTDASRGMQAYAQAHEYIAGNNPDLRGRRLKRLAWRYLLLTASPPLTRQEKHAARQARKLR